MASALVSKIWLQDATGSPALSPVAVDPPVLLTSRWALKCILDFCMGALSLTVTLMSTYRCTSTGLSLKVRELRKGFSLIDLHTPYIQNFENYT